MLTPISYIYDLTGKPEYAVIPIKVWENLQEQLQKIENKFSKGVFEPTQFWGCLSLGDLDIEQELSLMRSQWNRDF